MTLTEICIPQRLYPLWYQIWQVIGWWTSPYEANVQMTLMLHNHSCRHIHRALNEENPSSGFRDMSSTKSGAAACLAACLPARQYSSIWKVWGVKRHSINPSGAETEIHSENRLITWLLILWLIALLSHQQQEALQEHIPLPWSCLFHVSRGHFKKAYRLLNLRNLKLSPVNKMHSFQCMGKSFCMEFSWEPLKFHTKYFTHTLKVTILIKHWNFKSSWI